MKKEIAVAAPKTTFEREIALGEQDSNPQGLGSNPSSQPRKVDGNRDQSSPAKVNPNTITTAPGAFKSNT